MHGAFRSANGVAYKAASYEGKRGRARESTTRNPWLKQAFDEQDRLGVTAASLSKMSGVAERTIVSLRQPNGRGKKPTWDQVVSICEAMDFRVPHNLTKNGD